MLRAVLLCAVCLRAAFAAAPAVTKVEPPDWVAEPGGVTLRMLVTGHDLAGASVKSEFPASRVTVSTGGTHLFVDLTLPPNAAPGAHPLQIVTADGSVEAPFSIAPPLPPAGRFQGFSNDDVLYLIMPDRFSNGDPSDDDPAVSRGLHDRAKSRYYHGGDLEGIIQRLPYLKKLGVTSLWLTPIYDNANRLNRREMYDGLPMADYHGYGTVDFYAVDEHLGTLEKFRELVDKAHALGLKVIQDQVANHTGPYHPWVEDPPTPTWYNGTEANHAPNSWRTWTLIGPYSTPETQRTTLGGWFANILPDLNQDDQEVTRYLIQNSLWWIARTGIDGIRQDTLPYAPRRYWQEWTQAIHKRYPRFTVLGEVFDADPALVSYFQGGVTRDGVDTGVDTLFDFPLQSAIRKVFAGAASITELPRMLAHDYLYPDASRLVSFVDLHDVPRFLNDRGATAAGLEQVFTFLMTVRGVPLIYYGDEIGMTGGGDPDNRRDFPGGWKEDAQNAFEASGRTPAQERVFQRLRRLAAIRAEVEPLRRGATVDLLVENTAYAFARVTPQSAALVVFNNSLRPATLQIPVKAAHISDGATLKDALGAAPPIEARDGVVEVRLEPRSAAIYR
jgi:glycosidase